MDNETTNAEPDIILRFKQKFHIPGQGKGNYVYVIEFTHTLFQAIELLNIFFRLHPLVDTIDIGFG
jgi:hypothetical protein